MLGAALEFALNVLLALIAESLSGLLICIAIFGPVDGLCHFGKVATGKWTRFASFGPSQQDPFMFGDKRSPRSSGFWPLGENAGRRRIGTDICKQVVQ